MGCLQSSLVDQDDTRKAERTSKAFLEISIDEERVGRILCELWSGSLPKTTTNFMTLCRGAKGYGYKGKKFHRIIPGFCVQGGEVGRSIYGKTFKDEHFNKKHAGAGTLYMANAGPDTNSSQFFICTAERCSLDSKHVAFGRVVSGMQVVAAMEECGSSRGHTTKNVTISDCGTALDTAGAFGSSFDFVSSEKGGDSPAHSPGPMLSSTPEGEATKTSSNAV